MPNFTNLPERRFVDKAKKLSFGDQDKDTYFDGDTLNTMLGEMQEMKVTSLVLKQLSKNAEYVDIIKSNATTIENGKIMFSWYSEKQVEDLGIVPFEIEIITNEDGYCRYYAFVRSNDDANQDAYVSTLSTNFDNNELNFRRFGHTISWLLDTSSVKSSVYPNPFNWDGNEVLSSIYVHYKVTKV